MNSPTSDASPLSCEEIQELLPDFVTGELDGASAHAIERHALACESCAHEIAGWKQATGLVKRASNAQPRPIEQQARQSPNGRRIPFLRPLALAASLAITFLLGIAAGRFGTSSGPGPLASTPEARENLATRYQVAASASPNANSLSLALLSIARRE